MASFVITDNMLSFPRTKEAAPGNSNAIEIHVQASTKLLDDQCLKVPVYSTHSKNRGAALIINNVKYIGDLRERVHAENDSLQLETLLRQIGMEVESHGNLTGEQMMETISCFKCSPKLEGVDMVFIIVMGHGHEDLHSASIVGTNGLNVTTAWIEDQFVESNCEVLKGKPKIILYQTCCEKMRTHEVDRHVGKGVRDMLVIHSTMQVDYPQCNIVMGNLYINCLCKAIMEHAHSLHLEEVLKLANEELSRQPNSELVLHTPSYTNMNFKTCYLHPKVYLDEEQIKQLPNVS